MWHCVLTPHQVAVVVSWVVPQIQIASGALNIGSRVRHHCVPLPEKNVRKVYQQSKSTSHLSCQIYIIRTNATPRKVSPPHPFFNTQSHPCTVLVKISVSLHACNSMRTDEQIDFHELAYWRISRITCQATSTYIYIWAILTTTLSENLRAFLHTWAFTSLFHMH